MIYAYDAGVISQSPEKLRRVMGVIVVVGLAFGLTVSEAKTEIMCLRTKEMPHTTTIFSVEAAGQANNQKPEFVYLGGTSTTRRPIHRGASVHTQRTVQLPAEHYRTVRPTERSPRAQNLDAKSRRTRDSAVRLRHLESTSVAIRHAAPSPSQHPDSLHRLPID